MIQTHRLAGIAVFLWGFYLVYSSLSASYGELQYMEPPPAPALPISFGMPFYLPLVVGIVSMVFGIYLMVRRKPIFDNQNEHSSITTKDSQAQ
jgi:uncharacterized membrane protein YfcA